MSSAPSPHVFNPWLNYYDPDDSMVDIWRGTGLTGEAYFAARNNSAPLVAAAQTNDLPSVGELILQGAALDQKGLEGETALHMASALGHVDIVQALVTAGTTVDMPDSEGSTPLIHAIRFCPAPMVNEVASILLSAGANPIHMATIDLSRHTPLWFAVKAHKEDVVRLLEPLTPRELDVYPPGSTTSRNHIIDAAISAADEHGDTFVLDFLIQARSLPLQSTDLAKASNDRVFSVLAKHLFPDKEQVAAVGVHILDAMLALGLNPNRLGPALRRLVHEYKLDINRFDVQRFIICSRRPDLVTTGVELGMDINTVLTVMNGRDMDFKSFILGLKT